MTMHEFSFTVPGATASVKTFTFPGPVTVGSYCADSAAISCCPRSSTLYLNTTGGQTGRSISLVGVVTTGQHFRTDRRAASSAMDGGLPIRSNVDTLTLWNFGNTDCEGATIEMKLCVTMSDYRTTSSADAQCNCDENCVPGTGVDNPTAISYVGVTGVL